MLVYWFWTMARIGMTSRGFPGVAALPGTWFGQLLLAIGLNCPVNVEREMLFQSTWNL